MASSSDSVYITQLANMNICLHRYVVTILYVLGNLGTVISLAIFLKRSWRKNVCSFYFLVCLVNNMILINSSMIGTIFIAGFNVQLQNASRILCKLFYYCSYLFSNSYPIILILASIDRLLISSQNVDTRLYSSKRLAYFSTSTALTVCCIFSLHILIKVDIQEIYPSYFICYFDMSKFYLDFFSYSSLALSMIVPFIMPIMSIVAFKNVRRIRAVPRPQRREIRSMTKKDFQLLRCLYVHNLSYIVFTIVLSVSIVANTTVRYQHRSPVQQAMDSFVSDVGSFLHEIPYCTSFFIFVALSKAFRYELKRWAYQLCGKDLATIRGPAEEDNKQQGETVEMPDVVVISSEPARG